MFSFFVANAQSDSLLKLYSAIVEKQCTEMAFLLKNKNYEAFLNYTHPDAIKAIGSKNKAIEITESTFSKLESAGCSIDKIFIENPCQFLQEGLELQCIVTQILEMKTPKGNVRGKSTFIGVSQNNGKNWFFVDSKGKEIEVLRKTIPSLSSKLIIPKKENPEFIND